MLEAGALEGDQKILSKLLEKSVTLSLGTINQKQRAEVSLVPFLYHMDCFWIFVSELSKHTQHLTAHSEASVLVRNEEDKIANPFSIVRLSATCQVELESNMREEILDVMTLKLGKTVLLLRQLEDFRLFRLKPVDGRLVAGFGKAFDVDFSLMSLTHINKPSAN